MAMTSHPPPAFFALPALSQIAELGLLATGYPAVATVAVAVWYEAELPDTAAVQGPFRTESLLLLERLVHFPVVPPERKKTLLAHLRVDLAAVPETSQVAFHAAFKRYLPRLQPLQTREAARALNAMHPRMRRLRPLVMPGADEQAVASMRRFEDQRTALQRGGGRAEQGGR